ncbi:L,D-transpeptidase family protein [Stenotrophomonas sp. SORGH_AS_0321]|uniref:L,D-transpeptidase family protein n=1 Tax=Stenotrophomonas sp. SORGH_AS_0321 TaxID=3041787 RepID=UPI00285BA212|nr:L,D-transpeptidase family protein [Stenotrophomonas sp. SORGH_AS_0321]MDR6096014.1 L,D-peptidoglycan transpeptidase YkuD (ErfK/YbiS/YcfS/YnhG family) [Stenotrophomonas sp. SORGH_AS_0321]
MKSLLRCLAVAALLLAGPAWAASPLDGARQVVVVTSEGWDSTQGRLQAFARTDHGWKPEGAAFDVALGRSGSAWGIGLHPATDALPSKREGDGRSPAGVFALGTAFGYAAQADTALPWQPMQESSYCMDVPDSPYYNRIVDAGRVGAEAVEGSTEPMRLDLHNHGDVRYQQGFVINHNPRNVPGQGSCIFAHLWRREGEATAGCTAMTAAHMQQLLAWLDPRSAPVFVLLPHDEYARLQQAWQLPALPAANGHAR